MSQLVEMKFASEIFDRLNEEDLSCLSVRVGQNVCKFERHLNYVQIIWEEDCRAMCYGSPFSIYGIYNLLSIMLNETVDKSVEIL